MCLTNQLEPTKELHETHNKAFRHFAERVGTNETLMKRARIDKHFIDEFRGRLDHFEEGLQSHSDSIEGAPRAHHPRGQNVGRADRTARYAEAHAQCNEGAMLRVRDLNIEACAARESRVAVRVREFADTTARLESHTRFQEAREGVDPKPEARQATSDPGHQEAKDATGASPLMAGPATREDTSEHEE